MSNARFVSNRRSFLQNSAALGAAALGANFFSLQRRLIAANASPTSAGYGPLHPVADEATGLELIQLPEGFRYVSFGWTGDPMADGRPTPPAHDGMAVIGADDDGRLVLCRNHELNDAGAAFGPAEITYDAQATAGCTNLLFDPDAGNWVAARPSLSGTLRNCAGGPTPWGSWLSCEETVLGPGDNWASPESCTSRYERIVMV